MTNKELDWIFHENKPLLKIEHMFIGLPLAYLALLLGIIIFEKYFM